MEGLVDIEVIEMGDNLVLLKCNKSGEMESAKIENRRRWEANFKDI